MDDTTVTPPGSPRRQELLAAAYAYTLRHGVAGMSLRPLANATGTSPRVLLYLFGSKDDLIAEILAVARREQLALVAGVLAESGTPEGLADGAPGDSRGGVAGGDPGDDAFDVMVGRLWSWLSAPSQRDTIRLFFEAYARSLRQEPGPWRDFAARSVRDWLDLLVRAQPGTSPEAATSRATRTIALLRGLLLDIVACEDADRVDAAFRGEHPPRRA